MLPFAVYKRGVYPRERVLPFEYESAPAAAGDLEVMKRGEKFEGPLSKWLEEKQWSIEPVRLGPPENAR